MATTYGTGKVSDEKIEQLISSGGELRVLGLDPDRDGVAGRTRLGVVPLGHDPELTVEENLRIYGRYFRLRRQALRPVVDELLEFAPLTDRRLAKTRQLSGGM
jgi:lipooligosaccharide transport system ATP-binding protein